MVFLTLYLTPEHAEITKDMLRISLEKVILTLHEVTLVNDVIQSLEKALEGTK